jgi:predicted GIY-YIG superfamily endonuclease
MNNSNSNSNYLCYCIQNDHENKTYIGITNHFQRRIKQHNGELSGGAKYTRGDHWKPIIITTNFRSKCEVLRFEYLWKKIRIKTTYKSGVLKRIEILHYLLLHSDEWKHINIFSTKELAVYFNDEQIHDIDSLFI